MLIEEISMFKSVTHNIPFTNHHQRHKYAEIPCNVDAYKKIYAQKSNELRDFLSTTPTVTIEVTDSLSFLRKHRQYQSNQFFIPFILKKFFSHTTEMCLPK